MPPFTFSDIQQAATQATGDATLRLSVTDGSVKTAKHGFKGRLVRFFHGPTKKDLADNNRLMGRLLGGLKRKYGDDIGTRAFLAARPEARTAGDDIFAQTGRGLTARQVKTAIAYAEAAQSEQFRASARAQADVFRPGTPMFDLVAEQARVNPATLSREQKTYFQSRLREKVIASAMEEKEQPLGSAVQKLAVKLLKHTAQNVGAAAPQQIAAHQDTHRAAGQLLSAISGRGNPGQALLDFMRLADGIIEDSAMGGEVGADDQLRPRLIAMDRAVARLGKRQAKALYDQLMAPDGPGRKALLAILVASDRISSLRNPYKAGAAGDMTQALKSVLGALAIRAGVGLEEFNRVADEIEGAKMDGPQTKGIPDSALKAAGITDAKGVAQLVTQFDQAMDRRAESLH